MGKFFSRRTERIWAKKGELENGDWGKEFGEERGVGARSVEREAWGDEVHQNDLKIFEISHLR